MTKLFDKNLLTGQLFKALYLSFALSHRGAKRN